jgi:succinate dehydrogenase/fumarate reductase flavoprotein subunit
MNMDREVDVVVVGGGVGGCSAAVEAARAGATVTLLEAGPELGGNAARSTGYLAFACTAMQRDAGIQDSPHAFLADMRAEVDRQSERYGILFDEDLARRFAEESGAAHGFLVDLGVRFNRFIPRPRQHTVDRMIDTVDVTAYRTCFENALADLGVEVLAHTRAQHLLVEDGAIVGVRAASRDHEVVNAIGRHAVVLAAGGYQANVDLRRRYQPAHLADTPYLGVDTDRGDGHVMGAAVGGDLINMTMVPPLIMVASAFVEDAIAVNLAGQRFHDEAGPYDDRVAALAGQPDRLAYYVYDNRVATDKALLIEQMPEQPRQAHTLRDLASEIGCDPVGLEATVAQWNAAVVAGRDDDHGRVVMPREGSGIVQPPFRACRMVVGINFPAGGFRVTTDMEVVDLYGQTIPGLLAVGDCVGGIAPAIGLGGLKITPAVTLGRVAGRVAAAGPPRTPRAVGGALVDGVIERDDHRMRIAVVDLDEREEQRT